MPTITAGDFRNGVTFEMDGKVMTVVEFQHVKPGKGAAFVRTKYKNVMTGAIREESFNPTAKFEQATVERKDAEYSYNDGDLYYFMDPETFDMVPLRKMQRLDVVNHLLQTGADGEAALIRHIPEKHIEIGNAILITCLKITVAHGQLIEVAEHGHVQPLFVIHITPQKNAKCLVT